MTDITYGQWERGLLPVHVDGVFAGYLSEDADGWVFWRQTSGTPTCFEMHTIAPTRRQAVTDSVGGVLEHD